MSSIRTRSSSMGERLIFGKKRRRAITTVLAVGLASVLFVDADVRLAGATKKPSLVAKHSGANPPAYKIHITESLRRREEEKDESTPGEDAPTYEIIRQLRSKSSKASKSSKSSSSSGDSVSIGIAGKGKGGKSSKSSKGSKSSKSGGKGKGRSNIFDDSYDDDGHTQPTPNMPTGPTSPTGPSSPTRAPKSPTGPGFPTFPTQPTGPSQPTVPSTPTDSPGGPDSPTGVRDPPTMPPNFGPTPTAPTPTAPTTPPTPPEPRCQFAQTGLFGSQLGLAEVSSFAYQATVSQTVTAAELNLDILNKVETTMGERILARILDQCAVISAEQRSSPIYTTYGGSKKVINPFGHSGKRRQLSSLRTLQTGTIEGFSIRPRDIVVEGVDCVNVEPVFPCFVIQGRVTSYTEGTIDENTKQKVRDAIRNSIEAGGLDTVDNRILDISWRDLNSNPLPDNGGGTDDLPPNQPPSDQGTPPTSAPVGNPPTPVIRASGGPVGLETWAIALIAVGGAVSCCMAYLCLRRPTHTQMIDDYDDDKSSSDSSSSSSYLDEDDKEGNGDGGDNNENANTTNAFVAPMPIYRPPPAATDDANDQTRSQDQGNLNSTQPPPEQNPYAFAAPATATNSSNLSPVNEGFGDANESGFEEESSSESESESESSSEESTEEGDAVGAMPVDQSTQPSAASDMDFSQPSKFEEDFGGQENAFPTVPPPTGSTSEEFSSEYSSYEDEEVEEEYEIEYVEDDVDGLEGVEEEEESGSSESPEEEEFWDEEGGEEAGGQAKESVLPWLGAGSTHSAQSFG